jgi:hypothetical protein
VHLRHDGGMDAAIEDQATDATPYQFVGTIEAEGRVVFRRRFNLIFYARIHLNKARARLHAQYGELHTELRNKDNRVILVCKPGERRLHTPGFPRASYKGG